MRIPSRRTFWLSAATLLVAVVACSWFFMPRSRISRENFERIQNGMSWDEVIAIIGKPPERGKGLLNFMSATWHEGADYISVTFALPAADLDRPDEPIAVIGFGTVCDKTLHLATAWEAVQWYAKRGAEKIGVKWSRPQRKAIPRSVTQSVKLSGKWVENTNYMTRPSGCVGA